MARGDPAVGVQQRLDHRRAGLGEQRAHQRKQRLGVRPAVGDAAGAAVVEHAREALGAEVGRRGDGAGAAHEDQRVEVRVLAAQNRELGRGLGEHGQRVDVDAQHRLLDADHAVGVVHDELRGRRGAGEWDARQ